MKFFFFCLTRYCLAIAAFVLICSPLIANINYNLVKITPQKWITKTNNWEGNRNKLPMRNLPSTHATWGERGYVIIVINATNTNNITLIGWIIKCSIKWSIISNCRNHDNIICSQFPDLVKIFLNKMLGKQESHSLTVLKNKSTRFYIEI